MMIGLKCAIKINHPIPKPLSLPNFHFLSSPLKPQFKNPNKIKSKFALFAQKENGDEEKGRINNNGNEERNPPIFNLKIGDLLLNPDPDNLVAVGLTGLLAWASAQVLWQLVIVSLAILVAAVKYSFVAALLVFILITLL